MLRSFLTKISLVTKAGLAIFALAAITVGILANIHSVKSVREADPIYPICVLAQNERLFEDDNILVRATLSSYSQGVLQLIRKSCNETGEIRLYVAFDKDFAPSTELQKLLDDLRSFHSLNEYKSLEVKVAGRLRGDWSHFVVTDIQPLTPVTSNYFEEVRCEVHNRILQRDFLNVHYSIPDQGRGFLKIYQRNKDQLFPNSNIVVLVRPRMQPPDCVNGDRRRVYMGFSYCQKCRIAEMEWTKANVKDGISLNYQLVYSGFIY